MIRRSGDRDFCFEMLGSIQLFVTYCSLLQLLQLCSGFFTVSAQMRDVPSGVTVVPLNINTTLVSVPGNSRKLEICSTGACISLANQFLSAVNFSVDPCDDFQAFSCGNYIARHPVSGSEQASVTGDVGIEAINKIKAMLQLTPYDNYVYDQMDAEVKVKRAYQQCVSNRLSESFNADALLTYMGAILPGGWPMITPNWDPAQFDLFSVVLNAAVYGVQPFFVTEVVADFTNPTQNLLIFAQPSTFASKDTLNSEDGSGVTSSYLQKVVETTQLIPSNTSGPRPASAILNDAIDIVNLEKNIALAGLNFGQQEDISLATNKTTLGSFQDGALKRSSLFQRFIEFHRALLAIANVTFRIDRNTVVVPLTFDVFVGLDQIVASLEAMGDEGKRRLANYIGWQLINANVPYLSRDVQELHENHLRRIRVLKEDSPPVANITESKCIGTMQSMLPLALETLYVRKYVPADLQPKVAMLITDTKLGFADLLREATWMENATKILALQKLDNMLNFVAFSNEVVNNKSAVNTEYSQVE
ncbi:hypothetical protein RvY_11604-1 [Ramazzottius varieornatus]|uniref:Peptidase M13 N-terminal domain-containing protein n=1 Tax=Ramazzottius varieornatus TaxID=947166 RepID=A0A1D1VGM6_RAMVA|nr:hypothetical protein RvY_11604-1 [Ramazzottius varieornatus]